MGSRVLRGVTVDSQPTSTKESFVNHSGDQSSETAPNSISILPAAYKRKMKDTDRSGVPTGAALSARLISNRLYRQQMGTAVYSNQNFLVYKEMANAIKDLIIQYLYQNMGLKRGERTYTSIKIEYASQISHLKKKIFESFSVLSAAQNFWIVTEIIEEAMQRDRKENVEASKRVSKKRTWNEIESSLAGYKRQQQPSKNERRVSNRIGASLNERNRNEVTIAPSDRRGQLHTQHNSEEGIDPREVVQGAPPRNQETTINRSDAVHRFRQPCTESGYPNTVEGDSIREKDSTSQRGPIRGRKVSKKRSYSDYESTESHSGEKKEEESLKICQRRALSIEEMRRSSSVAPSRSRAQRCRNDDNIQAWEESESFDSSRSSEHRDIASMRRSSPTTKKKSGGFRRRSIVLQTEKSKHKTSSFRPPRSRKAKNY